MKTFKDRAEAFEYEFAHNAEMHFRADMRADRLIGMWAAGLLAKSGDDAIEYVREVVRADLAKSGKDNVIQKLAADLADHIDEATLRAKVREITDEAKRQLHEERERMS